MVKREPGPTGRILLGRVQLAAGEYAAARFSFATALSAARITPRERARAHLGRATAAEAEADVVIWPADPLELTSYPEQVFIKGNAVDMTSRQTLLRDRYLQMDSDEPPAWRR